MGGLGLGGGRRAGPRWSASASGSRQDLARFLLLRRRAPGRLGIAARVAEWSRIGLAWFELSRLLQSRVG